MDVYLEGNFWGHRGMQEKLECIPIRQDFVWEDVEGRILALYIGNKGVVLDLVLKTSVEEVKAFLERWPEEVREQLHSKEEIEQFENDNPVETDFRVDLTINGTRLKNRQSCAVCWYPALFEENARDEVSEELMQEYQLDKNAVWSFQRTSYEWNEKIEPKDLEFGFQAYKVSVSGEHFITKSGCEEHIVSFSNPITKEQYQLMIYGCEPQIFDADMDAWKDRGLEYPTHYHELCYSMESDMGLTMGNPDLQFRLMDCKDGDEARKVDANEKRAGRAFVIGGANGPTSFFVAGKSKSLEQKKLSAFSSMYFEEQQEIEWRPVFQTERRKDMEFCITL